MVTKPKTSLEHCTNVDQRKYDVISEFHVMLLCHQIQYLKNVNVTLFHRDSVMVILVMYQSDCWRFYPRLYWSGGKSILGQDAEPRVPLK